MHEPGKVCHVLMDETVVALDEDVIAIMLVAVQKHNLAAAASAAVQRLYLPTSPEKKH